jgi:hypothetical protein
LLHTSPCLYLFLTRVTIPVLRGLWSFYAAYLILSRQEIDRMMNGELLDEFLDELRQWDQTNKLKTLLEETSAVLQEKEEPKQNRNKKQG